MFIRKKKNKSGSFSIQIIDKSSGEGKILKVFGCGKSDQEVRELMQKAYELLPYFNKQSQIDFPYSDDVVFLKQLREGVKKIFVVGPELILGKIFDEIGYHAIPQSLFRHLIITIPHMRIRVNLKQSKINK